MNNLRKVNWRSLRTCHGFATEVPKWIEQLTSPIPSIRQTGFEKLTDHIYHQGSIYEVTAHVVPFLIKLLEDPSTQDKARILSLLWLLSSGRPAITNRKEWLKSSLEEEGRDFYQEIEKANLYVQSTKNEIHKGIPLYLTLVSSEEPAIRLESVRLLSNLPQDLRRILPVLTERVYKESDQNVRALILWAIGRLVADAPDVSSTEKARCAKMLAEFLSPRENEVTRLAASVSQLRIAGNMAAEEAIETLIETIARSKIFPHLPWLDTALWTASSALCELHGEKRLTSFRQAFLQSLSAENSHDIIITLAIALLSCVFKGNNENGIDLATSYNHIAVNSNERFYKMTFSMRVESVMTQEQKGALEIISELDEFWKIRTNLLEAFGLPNSRDELRKLASCMSE